MWWPVRLVTRRPGGTGRGARGRPDSPGPGLVPNGADVRPEAPPDRTRPEGGGRPVA